MKPSFNINIKFRIISIQQFNTLLRNIVDVVVKKSHLIIITYLKFLFIFYKYMRAVAQIVLVVEKKTWD